MTDGTTGSPDPDQPGPPTGSLTLAATFAFVVLFRLEGNVAYVLGLGSTRDLVTTDALPIGPIVHLLAPFLHATPDHLVGTLVWFVPFGYFLERRTTPENYLAFVVVAGYLTTTLVPAVFVVLGAAPGLGIGASGITHALVGRESTARAPQVLRRRSRSRRQRAIAGAAVLGLLLAVVGIGAGVLDGTPVLGHATGVVLGVAVGLGERYVAIDPEWPSTRGP